MLYRIVYEEMYSTDFNASSKVEAKRKFDTFCKNTCPTVARLEYFKGKKQTLKTFLLFPTSEDVFEEFFGHRCCVYYENVKKEIFNEVTRLLTLIQKYNPANGKLTKFTWTDKGVEFCQTDLDNPFGYGHLLIA